MEVAVYRHYCPDVKRVIATGTSAFIGEVDKSTVLKYPLSPSGDVGQLAVERKLLEIVSPHPRITLLKSFSDTGLYLERATNGTLAYYLLESDNLIPSIQQRLAWCREAAEAVAHVHSKRTSPPLNSTNPSLGGGAHASVDVKVIETYRKIWEVGTNTVCDTPPPREPPSTGSSIALFNTIPRF
ncbi:hypothetical protein V500_06870 [Pseudogymnoascus sp. VKM F-4518 (FW-2643)]|nr:hypothetical protein V500_06870 [Pseudogymnoascus sp. VKM F-4518 (FW-2643)]